jgi:hypothetical protein
MYRLIANVMAEVKLSVTLMKGASSSSNFDKDLCEFFRILPKPERQVLSSLVRWLPPPRGCRKINIDGSVFGTPSCGSIGVVFRDCEANFLGGFVQNIGHASVIVAELCAAMYAIEKAVEFGWSVF